MTIVVLLELDSPTKMIQRFDGAKAAGGSRRRPCAPFAQTAGEGPEPRGSKRRRGSAARCGRRAGAVYDLVPRSRCWRDPAGHCGFLDSRERLVTGRATRTERSLQTVGADIPSLPMLIAEYFFEAVWCSSSLLASFYDRNFSRASSTLAQFWRQQHRVYVSGVGVVTALAGYCEFGRVRGPPKHTGASRVRR